MKLNGVELGKPKNKIIPIIRGEEEIIFEAACITDQSELDNYLTDPEPPAVIRNGQTSASVDLNDKNYVEAVKENSTKRVDWMVAKSLLATEGLEWDTVDFTNPDTWGNYREELQQAGFNNFQIMRLVNGVLDANGLNEERVAEARNRFLATQQEALQQ